MAEQPNIRNRADVRRYIDELATQKAADRPNVKRWMAVKRWSLVALLILAVLIFYFIDVFIEMLKLPGISVFIPS